MKHSSARSQPPRGPSATATASTFTPSSASYTPIPPFPQDWWIALDDYEGYVRAVHLENLVHSPSGAWGFVELETYAVAVAGSQPFLDALLDKWPSYVYGDAIYGPRRQVEAYLAELGRSGYPEVVMRWLPSLLSHMYGDDEGSRLLAVYAAASVTKS